MDILLWRPPRISPYIWAVMWEVFVRPEVFDTKLVQRAAELTFYGFHKLYGF